MSPEVKSEEDTLEFGHMRKPVCKGKRERACVSVSVSLCALTLHMAHSLTHPDMDSASSEI